ncbi:SpoIIE family protein phosphatase [Myxosarcina sp. GI1]|uniref:SpoIIE family protein phosphatase n=1 Tax=Myxosarcina sp. GI1 TaxID=1541065 RepID=UPI0005685B73|nr:SpoIIE family protein phosphatase [Myxosarcina sp. GI1]
MSTDLQSQLSILAHLRHELRNPINAIVGYSEMLLEDLEATTTDPKVVTDLTEISLCGKELLNLVNTFLNPELLNGDTYALKTIVANPTLQVELQKPTQQVINYCQKLLNTANIDSINYSEDLNKICTAASHLSNEIANIIQLYEEVQSSTSIAINDNLSTMNLSDAPEYIADRHEELSQDTILIVDDSQANRDLLSRQVEAQGYRVATAADGRQALEMIQKGQYDLILLDVMMPEIDGYQVLQWIRHSNWQHIPVIMISALDKIDSVVKCIEMGAEDYLPKPFNSVLLKARINACLNKKKLRDRETLYLSKLAEANTQITQLNQLLTAENSRLSAELEISQRLQKMILPKEQELNSIKELEIAGFMEPADEVGGDYYDVLQNNGQLKIAIGDVTGHGLESGVLMLMVQTAVRTLMESNQTDPKKFLEILNRTIYKNIQRMNSDKYLSLCLVDFHGGKLKLSGQHEEILVIRSGGNLERIDTIDLGFPIGLEVTIEEFVFQVEIELEPEDVVVLYTDGITEAENDLGIQYGLEKLSQIVKNNCDRSAENIRQIVVDDVKKHIGFHKIYDDITLVVIKKR